jgi:hypothetical protein
LDESRRPDRSISRAHARTGPPRRPKVRPLSWRPLSFRERGEAAPTAGAGADRGRPFQPPATLKQAANGQPNYRNSVDRSELVGVAQLAASFPHFIDTQPGLFPTSVAWFEKSQWPDLSFVGYRTDEMKQPAFNLGWVGLRGTPWLSSVSASITRRPLKSGLRKKRSNLKKPPKSNLSAAWPENCFCGVPAGRDGRSHQ